MDKERLMEFVKGIIWVWKGKNQNGDKESMKAKTPRGCPAKGCSAMECPAKVVRLGWPTKRPSQIATKPPKVYDDPARLLNIETLTYPA